MQVQQRKLDFGAVIAFVLMAAFGAGWLAQQQREVMRTSLHCGAAPLEVAVSAGGGFYSLNDADYAASRQDAACARLLQRGPIPATFFGRLQRSGSPAVWAAAFLAALAWALLTIINRQPEEALRRSIGQDVIDEALAKAQAQVPVPKEVQQTFVARYWLRLSKLFKLQ